MKLIRFLFSSIFVRHLMIAGLIFFFIISFTMLFIRIYTHHNKSMTLPNFSGLTIPEAELLARAKKLRIEVIDSVYQGQARLGTVVDQIPHPGFKVKRNRRILLTINANQPEKVTMPDVIGVSLRQAKAILETKGLNVGKLTYVPDLATNNVLKQSFQGKTIAKDEIILKGSYIDLTLGNGYSNQHTLVPHLIGMTVKEAKSLLLHAFLNIGACIYDKTIKSYADSTSAFIWKQHPESLKGKSIPLGSSVDIWLTMDSAKVESFMQIK